MITCTVALETHNPAFVCGPPLVSPRDPAAINETVRAVWTILSGQPISPPLCGSCAFVDERDMGGLMVFCVRKGAKMDGERLIAGAGSGKMQEIADVLNKAYPERGLSRGEPGTVFVEGYGFPERGVSVDVSKAVRMTGRGWIGFEESVLDAARVFERDL